MFLKKMLLFVLITGGITVAINAVYMNYDTTWDSYDRYRHVPENIQICNFGSSHGEAGFNYDKLKEHFTCFRFSGARQQLYYDNCLLQTYADHMEEGGIAFILISYFSLYGETELAWEDFDAYNNVYYRILPNRLIRRYDPAVDFYVSYFPSLRSYFNIFPTLFVRPDPDYVPPGEFGVDPQVVKDSAQSRYEGYVKRHRGVINEEGIDALYEMIALLQERNVTPVLISTPIMIDFTACIRRNDPAFYDDWHALIGKVCDDTGVTYHDYSEDSRITGNYKLFADADHLNKNGAVLFTDIITEEIIKTHFSE